MLLTKVLMLLWLALGLEVSSVWIYQSNYNFIYVLIILVHISSSLLAAPVLCSLLPAQYQTNRLRSGIFFFCLAFFIPFLGILGLSAIVLPVLYWPRRPKKEEHSPVLRYSKVPVLPSYFSDNHNTGVHNEKAKLVSILQGSSDPAKRLATVLATLRLPEKDAIPLLRLAIEDAEDDIRLLAYALLDRKEQAITERMTLKLKQLENNNVSTAESIRLHQGIAYDCWELIYLGLAQGEVLARLLETALEHTKSALNLCPTKAGLYFLLGNILLRQKKLDTAFAAFSQAEGLGFAKEKIAPYLAEIEFLKRHPLKFPNPLETDRFPLPKQLLRAIENRPHHHPSIISRAVAHYQHLDALKLR